MIIIVGTLGQAVAGHAPGVSIYGVMIMWRFVSLASLPCRFWIIC